MNIEDRIIELETKLSFQEQTIEELNQVIIEQQKLFDRLQLQIKQLNTKIDETSKHDSQETHEIPPHY